MQNFSVLVVFSTAFSVAPSLKVIQKYEVMKKRGKERESKKVFTKFENTSNALYSVLSNREEYRHFSELL